MRLVFASSVFALSALMAAPAVAQSAASNKAFFASGADLLHFAPVTGTGKSDVVTLFSIPAAVKTSNGGAVSATLSMEAVLWTYNLTTAIVNGGKSSSSSRAAIKAWIEVDGVQMEPGKVVYADRLQATGVTLALTCAVPDTTCTVDGTLELELFQATKNANAFTFFLGPLSPTLHTVEAKARAFIECRDSDGLVIACTSSTLAGYTNASTQAAIGKATLMIEEQQNWGKQ
ncbi:MAG: hypothetical protein JJE40_09260 [Vicinamibacteria bacterium]|nr:hypothetical protein [Vicinamibacteria bacterium]